MRRLPPSSTLFPYTTLCRSPPRTEAATALRATPEGLASDGAAQRNVPRRTSSRLWTTARLRTTTPSETNPSVSRTDRRSEEHTSELQSRQYLVCRLLLDNNIEDRLTQPLTHPVSVSRTRAPSDPPAVVPECALCVVAAAHLSSLLVATPALIPSCVTSAR